jgi:hypothetical protein
MNSMGSVRAWRKFVDRNEILGSDTRSKLMNVFWQSVLLWWLVFGIATDHGGYGLKEALIVLLSSASHKVVDFGAHDRDERDRHKDID